MSQSEWDIIHEEPAEEPEEHKLHAKTAIGAAHHATTAAQEAREAADHALKSHKEAARYVEHIESVLEQARELLGGEVKAAHELVTTELRELVSDNSKVLEAVAHGLSDVAKALRDTHGEASRQLAEALKVIAAPRRIVRDDTGRAIGVERTK